MGEGLHLTLLGGAEVSRDGKPISGFFSAKVRALLIYLAVTGRPHSREALASLLWGELPEADAKTNLRQALTNLRKLVGDHLLIDRETVAFDREKPYWLDVEEFDANLKPRYASPLASLRIYELRGPGSPISSPQPSISTPQSAIRLYRGDFLEGFHVHDAPAIEEWVLAERERLRERALQALHTLTAHHTARGEYTQAIDYARRLSALDPWREEAHRQLMLLLARTGQHSGALAQYEICRRVLREELGVEPAPETTALYERIRAAHSGPHHNLSPPTTPFVGREDELAHIAERLNDPDCRLLTLIGPGGIGKTRLAMQAASQYVDAFINGVWFVPLDQMNSTEALIAAIADALQIVFHSRAEPRAQLLNHLSQKELLLVLDGFEQLIKSAGLIGEMLARGPQIKVLVTARERLKLRGEWVVEVGGLPIPPAEYAEGVEAYGAVQLFVQCAQRVRANFTLTPGEGPAVARVCRLIEGLPLGIELAATWVRALNCREIAQEIERSLDFLATSQSDVPERQRSLRAICDHSWALLSDEERRAFRQLSVFRGGFRKEGAEPVAGATPRVVAALVDKSFLRRDPSGRYAAHEVLRQYAEEKLAQAGERERAGRAHCEFFSRFLWERESSLVGAQQKEALPEIVADIENVRAAWQFAVDQRLVAEIDRMCIAQFRFYELRGWAQEGIDLFERASAMMQDKAVSTVQPTDSGLMTRAKLLSRLGMLHYRLGHFDDARAAAHHSLSVLPANVPQAQIEEAVALNTLGNVAWSVGDLAAAQSHFTAALRIAQEAGSAFQVARLLNNLAIIALGQGDYAASQKMFADASARGEKVGNFHIVALALANCAHVTWLLGDFERAAQQAQRSLSIAAELGDHFAASIALLNLAYAKTAQKQYDEAQRCLEQALRRAKEIANRQTVAEVLLGFGRLALATGHLPEARAHWLSGLREARDIGAEEIMLRLLAALAVLYDAEGKPERAAELAALVESHPASFAETRAIVRDLRAKWPDLGQPLGQTNRTLEEVVERILEESRPRSPFPIG